MRHKNPALPKPVPLTIHILNRRGDCNCVPVHRLAACLQLGAASHHHISSEERESYLAAPKVVERRPEEGGRKRASDGDCS